MSEKNELQIAVVGIRFIYWISKYFVVAV